VLRTLSIPVLLALVAVSCVKQVPPRPDTSSGATACDALALPLQAYVSYIPPEGDLLTREFIERHACCPVVVVQNGSQGEEIFKRPIGFYGTRTSLWRVSENKEGLTRLDGSASGDAGERVAKALAKELHLLREVYADTASAGGQALQNEKGVFMVHAFNGESPGMPVVVFESIEMGRTPAQMKSNTALLRALAAEASDRRTRLELTSFGTGGGIRASDAVGAVVDIRGSMFVGFEAVREREGAPVRFVPVIRFSDLTTGARIIAYRGGESFEDRGKAEKEVRRVFLEESGWLTKLHRFGSEGTGEEDSLEHLFQRRGDLSLTMTTFGDEEVKRFSESLGLVNVNMEDWHLVESWFSIEKEALGQLSLLRLISDTHGLEEALVRSMYEWTLAARYSREDLVELLLWGLEGSPLEPRARVPNAALWTAFQGLEPNRVHKALVPMPASGDSAFLEPFAKELAETMLDDIQAQRAFSQAPFDPRDVETLSLSEEELRRLMKEHAQRLVERAKKLRQNRDDEHRSRSAAGELVDGLLYMPLGNGRQIPLLADRSSAGGAERAHVWARLKKWDDNENSRLSAIIKDFESFKTSKTRERMTYRSNMSTAMPKAVVNVARQLQTCPPTRTREALQTRSWLESAHENTFTSPWTGSRW
jgi:hypothetical protein